MTTTITLTVPDKPTALLLQDLLTLKTRNLRHPSEVGYHAGYAPTGRPWTPEEVNRYAIELLDALKGKVTWVRSSTR